MIGTILNNRYEILEKIGEGGMAEVYKARCHKLNRYDAVKILKRESANDPLVVEKFKREATAVANLSDSNIVNIFDVGTQDGINYIVMEYVKGKTLKQLINENVRLSYERAIDIAIQITKALDCAHRNNIIHRDIKPQNILITEEGIVKVTDFGIAKASSNVTITNSNKVIGSAHYFSPEQARGNYVDTRTDIYSLGVVIYEMVTGKVPFDAESPVTIALKHLQDTPIPPIELNSSIPSGLNTLIMRCMEKDPNNRYQSAREVLMDLINIQRNLNYEVAAAPPDNDHTRVMEPVNAPRYNDYDDEDDYDYEPRVNNKTKKYLIYALIGIFVLVIGVITAYALMGGKGNNKTPNNSIVDKGEEVEVPNVVGMTKDEAKAAIEEIGLVYEEELVNDSEVEKDKVISVVEPEVGSKVKKGRKVVVRVSLGAETNVVPDMSDIQEEQLEQMLRSYGFKVGKITREFSDEVEKGKVIRQSPEPGEELEEGGIIDFVISKGKEIKMVRVPNLKGKSIDEIEQIIHDAGLTVQDKNPKVTDDPRQVGKVFEQNPPANSEVEEGTGVSVSYYVLEQVTLPNLIGKNIGEIKKLDIVKNKKINIQIFPTYADDSYIVVEVDGYNEGDKVDVGTTIRLAVESPNGGDEEDDEEPSDGDHNGRNGGNRKPNP